MKQIFDWMRKKPLKAFEVYDGSIGVYPCEVNRLIDEAEAKFGGHAICYFDCPCEYQTEDINVGKIDEYYKKIRAKAIDEFAERVKRYVDCGHLCNPTELRWSDLTIETMIDTIAEQLKESE